MCHTPQTVDPDTGNTVDMKVFVHKTPHGQPNCPACKAGKPYQIIGFNQAVSDWSHGEPCRPIRGVAYSATSRQQDGRGAGQ